MAWAAVNTLHCSHTCGKRGRSLAGGPELWPSPPLALPPGTEPLSADSLRPKEPECKMAWFDLVGFAFLLLPFLSGIGSRASRSSHSDIRASPSPTLPLSSFQTPLHWALAANRPASQPAFGAHRLQSCVLRLCVAFSQGWMNDFFF